ncbi:MAG: ester cyclase, partial [Halobacteriales archaeon]
MDPRELLERHTAEVWNEGKLEKVDRYIAPDYVEHDPSVKETVDGPAAYRRNVELFRSAFPDLSVTILDIVVEGDKIAMRQRWEGTHEGEFLGVEPTGNHVEGSSYVFCRIEDEQIAETWV